MWLYEAIGLVFPTHTSLWEKIDYLTSKMLIWQPSGVGFCMDELEVQVRCPLSLNSASLCMDPLVWLYEANRLVVSAHTSL